MRRYGGLRTLLPITYVTFGLGYLAIIGVPPLAGFFSKDPIIETALAAGGFRGFVLGGAALLGAGITAFYMTRVMLMTFFGQRRWDSGTVHPHESPRVMTWPMIVLAVGSVFSGGLLAFGGALQRWLEPGVGVHEEGSPPFPAWVTIGAVQVGPTTAITLAVVAVGIVIAYRMYGTRPVPAEAPAGSVLTVAARKDLYGDAFNEEVFMRPGALVTRALVEVDDKGIDGSVTRLARDIGRRSGVLRLAQNGFAVSYALSMLAGAALVAAAMILAVRLW